MAYNNHIKNCLIRKLLVLWINCVSSYSISTGVETWLTIGVLEEITGDSTMGVFVVDVFI